MQFIRMNEWQKFWYKIIFYCKNITNDLKCQPYSITISLVVLVWKKHGQSGHSFTSID